MPSRKVRVSTRIDSRLVSSRYPELLVHPGHACFSVLTEVTRALMDISQTSRTIPRFPSSRSGRHRFGSGRKCLGWGAAAQGAVRPDGVVVATEPVQLALQLSDRCSRRLCG